jgi:hypothetical protein
MQRWVAVAVLFGGAGLASAQVAEFSLSGGVSRFGNTSLGTNVDSAGNASNVTINNGFRLTFRFALNTYKFMGHEFGYAYSRSGVNLGAGGTVPMSIQQGFYDFLVYATPEGSRIRPFAAGGAQFSSFFPPGASVYYGNQETKFGVNYGGGIKMRLTSIIGLRFDVREYNSGKPFKFSGESGRMNQLEASVGASFLF